MAGEPFPVLWLCGPAGVGKSTVSWQLFTELSEAGLGVAFLDTDQACMCYPAPPGDPGRQRVKARNVGDLVLGYRTAGAQCLIANGVLDPAIGMPVELLPRAAVLVCRLRADAAEVERRFVARHEQQGDLGEQLAQIRNEVSGMDRSTFADACVETTGVLASGVAALVKRECATWPGFRGALPAAIAPASGAGRHDVGGTVMLITGPTGVGKSTIGFSFYLRCLTAGLTAGYVDLDQVGFVRPATVGDTRGHRLKAHNLAALWRNYRGEGATHLVASGPIEDDDALRHYVAELPGADITVCRLRVGTDELVQRVLSRATGGSWPQPGDPLCGKPVAFLRAVAAQAVREAHAYDQAGLVALVIDTDGCTAAQSADMITRAAGWPPRAA